MANIQMTAKQLPRTMKEAVHQLQSMKAIIARDENDDEEGPPPEVLAIFNDSLEAGFIAGTSWVLALMSATKKGAISHREMSLILDGIELDIRRESFDREREVREKLGDERVNRLMRENGLKPEITDDGREVDDEDARAPKSEPSLRDIEETRAALAKMRGEPPVARRDAESPDSDAAPRNGTGNDGRDLGPTGFGRDLTPPSDHNRKDHGNN